MIIKHKWLAGELLLTVAMLQLGADSPAPTLDQLLDIAPERTPAKPHTTPTNAEDTTAVPVENKSMEAVIEQMRTVSNRLGRHRDSGLATQRLQKIILDRIDQMIKDARQSSSSSKSDGSASSNKQQSGSQGNAQQGQNQKPGQKGQAGNPASASAAGLVQDHELGQPIRQHRVEWGSLPPRLRDELLEGSAERFSPVYRALTEQYYKRLAEQQP